MPRFLAILKYVPAVLCGLLVVAWVVSLFVSIRFSANTRDHEITCAVANCSLLYIDIQMNPRFLTLPPRLSTSWREWNSEVRLAGKLEFVEGTPTNLGVGSRYVLFPIPLLVTLLLPFGVGPFTRFRFPLWSYFAWTAMVAAELAYCLR